VIDEIAGVSLSEEFRFQEPKIGYFEQLTVNYDN